MSDAHTPSKGPDILAGGSFLNHELQRRQESRRAAELADGLCEPDALILPLVLALAKLAAQRDARRHSST